MMSTKFWVIVEAEKAGISAVLAGEALRHAAGKAGLGIAVEVRGPEGVIQPLSGSPMPGDKLLLVGRAQAPAAYAGLPALRVRLDEVLEDAAGILDKLDKTGGPEALKAAVPAAAPGPDEGGATTAPALEKAPGGKKNIVAVTSCPTGIAHTFMAAEGLEQAAKALGYGMRVETQGSVGAGTPLTPEEIAGADLVLIAADREVDRGRFNGKRVYASGTKAAITQGRELIKKALAEARLQSLKSGQAGQRPAEPAQEKKAGPYKHLMTGVSFMLPFVVAGGLLIAIAFAIGGINVDDKPGSLGQVLKLIGGSGGFALMVPALSGYIAYSIADRPGIAPGMIGGLLCNILGAGFLGGIASGFLAGYGTHYLNKYISLPKNLAGLKPVLILPLLGTLLTGLVMYYIVGQPAAQLNAFLTGWLKGLQGGESVALGLLLGGMMALDMGGPVNKAAYAFSTGMLESGVNMPMAAVMAAGMTPPMAAALATRLFRNRFTPEERESGGAAFVLGLAFVSEGAIPFAARDPLRAIPAFVLGSAITGALSMVMGVKLMVPHGGVFVLPIPGAVSSVPLYAVAILTGTVVSALVMGILKRPVALNAQDSALGKIK